MKELYTQPKEEDAVPSPIATPNVGLEADFSSEPEEVALSLFWDLPEISVSDIHPKYAQRIPRRFPRNDFS